MAELMASAEVDVIVEDRMVGIFDEASEAGDRPASPHTVGYWLSTAPGMVYLESEDDVINARLCLQAWDGEPPFDDSRWDHSDVIVMDMRSGVLAVDEIAAGGQSSVFRLPSTGSWHTRVAWREQQLDPDDVNGDAPEAWALVQFWRGSPV